MDGEPIWDSEESALDFSPTASSTPTLSFVNGKQEVSIEPEKSYAEKEARGDVFESVSSTLQNLTQTEENFDYSLVDTGATHDGLLDSRQDITYPLPVFLSTVEPKYVDKEQTMVESTPPSSLEPDPEKETLMEEGLLLISTPSGITVERSSSPNSDQPSAFTTNATASTIAPSKPIDTTEDKLDHITVATSEKTPLQPSLTGTTDVTYSASNDWTTELGIKEYDFTTETPMSATQQTDNMSEEQAVPKSTIMVTSSPDIGRSTSTKPVFVEEEEEKGSGGEIHDFSFTKPTLQHTVTNDSDAMTPHSPPTPEPVVLQPEETLLPTPSEVHIIDSSENIFSTKEGTNLHELSAISTVSTVDKTSKHVPSVTHSEAFPFSEADGSGDQSHVVSHTEFSTVFPLRTTEQNITPTAVYTGQGDDETVSVKTVSEEMEANQATVSPSAFSSSYITMETTTKPVQLINISEEGIQEPSTATDRMVMSEEDDFSGESILDKLGTTSFMQVHSTVTDDQDMTTRTTTTQTEAEDSISSTTTTRTFTVDHTQTISKESSLIDIVTTPETAEFTQSTTDSVFGTSSYKTESPFNTRAVETSGVQISNIVSKESHITSAPAQEIPQSEGSGEESGEYDDGVSGDFPNTIVESTPPSQAPSTHDVLTAKSEAVMGTQLPVHSTVMEESSDFAHSTVTGAILPFTGGDGSGDQNEDTNTISVTPPTSIPTYGSSTVSAYHSLSTSQKSHLQSIHNATHFTSTTVDTETLGASSIDQEPSILEGSADNISETTEASKEYSIRTDEAEISYTKSTLDYSDIEMATLSTKLTSETTSRIPSTPAQTELMSSSLESGSGDTEDNTTETEGADDDGSGDLVSTVFESSPPSVSPTMERVTMTSLAEIKCEGTVGNQALKHAEGSETPTTGGNTEFSVKTDEAETSENKTTLDHLSVETSTQYTLFKIESASTIPSMAESSDTGSGDMVDTTSEGTEDEGIEDDGSGALIESAAPSRTTSTDITTENTKASKQMGITDLPLVVPTSTFTDLVGLGKQSTVTTMPLMTGTDSTYLTSTNVGIDSVVSTTVGNKGTLNLFTEDGGSGGEMLVTTSSELQKATSVTVEATMQSATSTKGTAEVQLSHSSTTFTETENTEDVLENSYTTLVDEVSDHAIPTSMVTDTDVTTPILSVIYQDSTDKGVTTVAASSSEIRSSKITTRLHDTKSNTSPVIIFTEEIKDEDELFSTVTDSMRDHTTKTEVITKDDMIIDADTVSVLEPSSPFAPRIITEEAAGITAVTITPQSSSILTEEPEGSGTDNPVLPSSVLYLPTQPSLEGSTAKSMDLSSFVKAEETETKPALAVDIADERFTAQTVAPSKMTPHLSTSTHTAQTNLYSTDSTTHYNTGKSHPSQTTSHITYSTNQPAFTTSDSAHTTSQHSHIITKPSHITSSQPRTILHTTSTISQSEFTTTQAMPKTSNLIDNFSGDSVSVEDSEMQTSKPGLITSTDTSLPTTSTMDVNSTLHGTVSANSGYNTEKTTNSEQSAFILVSQKSGTEEEGSGLISELAVSNGSEIIETTPAYEATVISHYVAQATDHADPIPYVKESVAGSTSSPMERSATATTPDSFFTSTTKFFQSSFAPILDLLTNSSGSETMHPNKVLPAEEQNSTMVPSVMSSSTTQRLQPAGTPVFESVADNTKIPGIIIDSDNVGELDYESTGNPLVEGTPDFNSIGTSEIEIETIVHPNTEYENDTSVRNTTQSDITVQPTAKYEVTETVQAERVEAKDKTTETVPIRSEMPFDSTTGMTSSLLLSEESSGDVVSEIFTEESTAVSFKSSTAHRGFSTTHSDALASLSKEPESTTYAPPIVTTSRFPPEAVVEMTLTAQPTIDTSGADDLSPTTIPVVSISTVENRKYTQYTQTTKQGVQLTRKEEVTTVIPSFDETSPASPVLQSYDSVTGSVDEAEEQETVGRIEETVTAILESTDHTTSSSDGVQIHSDTTVSPKDISHDTILVEDSARNLEALNGTQKPGLNIDLGYTVIGETYDIAGRTLS